MEEMSRIEVAMRMAIFCIWQKLPCIKKKISQCKSISIFHLNLDGNGIPIASASDQMPTFSRSVGRNGTFSLYM